MTSECKEHNFKAIYFREKRKGESFQRWVKIDGLKICGVCKKIVKEEMKEFGNAK